MLRQHPKLFIAALAIIAVILASWITLSENQSTGPAVKLDDHRETSFGSPFTGTTDTGQLDLQTHVGDANVDAVFQRYNLVDATSLRLPSTILHEFFEAIPNLIEREITPTYAQAYIHIDRRTIKCDSKYDCALSFYIDSPERYFSYHAYLKPNGEPVTELRQEPMPGVDL